ncbi:MAG: hypothetical protein JO120_05160 [Solirubrobacterales bacterium]|nr:hypothetical protein [Solirubrobacterales bacterium]
MFDLLLEPHAATTTATTTAARTPASRLELICMTFSLLGWKPHRL